MSFELDNSVTMRCFLVTATDTTLPGAGSLYSPDFS